MSEQLAQLEKKGGGKYDSGSLLINATSALSEYTFTDNYELVLIVTGATGANNYRPTYNGVTYSWKEGNMGQAYKGSAVVIQNIKANTKVTFSPATICGIYGYKYT